MRLLDYEFNFSFVRGRMLFQKLHSLVLNKPFSYTADDVSFGLCKEKGICQITSTKVHCYLLALSGRYQVQVAEFVSEDT